LSIDARLRIGISSCLLGQNVRYDGGHKREPSLAQLFGPDVEWVPVCPEVEVGMGTPREALQLTRDGTRVRMLTVETRVDYTDIMNEWAKQRVAALAALNLDAYVLKSRSPSCGKDGVAVLDPAAGITEGRGLFAEALIAALPDLPVEEEAGLRDPAARERFVSRVLAYHRSGMHQER
jgi:uncharacterized protein YbbK (DUF523 family)